MDTKQENSTQWGQVCVARFNAIQQQKMQDVPLLNPVLQVEMVGMQVWQKYYTAVLITPWCMNLLLYPPQQDDIIHPRTTYNFDLPSGNYSFLGTEEEVLGHFYSCALFSPMFEFQDQQAARETAEGVIKAVYPVSGAIKATDEQENKLSRREWLKKPFTRI